MARPKSEDKRAALLMAAARVIDQHGLGAPTALIAKEAGLANGTLFNYFATKTDLLNALYLELKREMATAAQSGLSETREPRDQLFDGWRGWTRWAVANPEKRRALTQLAASDEVSLKTRVEAARAMAGIGALIERVRAEGPMSGVSMTFVGNVVDAIATATMDAMVQDSANVDQSCRDGFDAVWRVLSGS